MKYKLVTLFILINSVVFGQNPVLWPEIQMQNLLYNNVSKVEVWEFKVSNKVIKDSALFQIRIYNTGVLKEYRYDYHNMNDTNHYRAKIYLNDEINHTITIKNIDNTDGFHGCPLSYEIFHPTKRIEYSNEKGQLKEVIDYVKGEFPNTCVTKYFYNDQNLLMYVELYFGKKLDSIYKMKYNRTAIE